MREIFGLIASFGVLYSLHFLVNAERVQILSEVMNVPWIELVDA